jgi:hypothetical protein
MGSILSFCQPTLAASSTTTTLVVSPTSAATGSIITMTATVKSGGSPLTSGQMKFCVASAAYCDNGALLGTVWVTSSGTATLRRALPLGTTSVEAVFVPNNSYLTSTSAATTVTITGIDPDTSPQTFLTGGSNASYIYSGDFNNDGYVDLAVYDSTLHTLQIFLGSSAGTFTTGVSLATTVYSSWAKDAAYWMVADINRDGNLDLVNGYTGQVFLGNGNGTFSAGSTLPSTACQGYDTSAYQSAIADVNGDGKPDIVITCAEYSNIYTLLGSGAGTFSAGPITSVSAVLGSNGVGGFGLADFNGDNKPDLWAVGYHSTSGDPNATTYLGNGSSGFTSSTATFTDVISNQPVITGDFRNTGYPDVITNAEGSEYVLLNNGTGIASYGPTLSYSPSLVGDFNGDGNLDYAAFGAETVYGLAGKGNGTFATATTVSISPSPGPNGGTTGDFYNNGRPAIAVTTGLSPSYVVVFPLLKTTPPVTVSCSPNPTTFGNSSTTCTAQTTAGATGNMSILYDGNAWGSGNVNGSGAFGVSGFGGWGPGSHSIVGNYAGDENYTSASGSTTYIIGQGETVTQITNSTPNPSTYGSFATFSALVNGNGATPGPTGTVTFFNGSTNLGSASVTATASTTNLVPYSQQLLTSPWSGYCASTSNVTANAAAPDGTDTAFEFAMPSSFTCGSGVSWGVLTSIVGGLQAGQVYTSSIWLRGAVGGEVVEFGLDDSMMHAVTLTTSWQRYSYTFPAYVTDGEQTRGFQMLSTDPSITYYAWGAQTEASSTMGPYVATYGATSASGTGAVATFSTTYIPAGAQAVTAVYNGDTNWLGSTSAATVQNVTPAFLTVTANNASKVYGTANPAFTPIYSGFVNGDTSAVLTGSPSLTTTATAASPAGSYPITAAAGTLAAANYSFVFVNGTLTITKATSSLSVSSTINPSTYGQSVTFTLTVAGSGSGVTPTGTVTLTKGGTTLLVATELSASGTATYTTSTLPVGVDTLQLNYSGDTNYF